MTRLDVSRPRLVSILLAAGLGMTLAGCQPDPSAASANNGVGYDSIERHIWSDPDTGCQYLFWRTSHEGSAAFKMVLTPRLGRDGKSVCSPLPAAQGGR